MAALKKLSPLRGIGNGLCSACGGLMVFVCPDLIGTNKKICSLCPLRLERARPPAKQSEADGRSEWAVNK